MLISVGGGGSPRAIERITLAQTDKACPLGAEITIGVSIEDLPCCRAPVADMAWSEGGGGC